MESLFRRKKLPSSFSDYDGVFSGNGSPAKSKTEDYREIFGGSKCSIPVLDLSELDGVADDVAREKGVDYSKIFGGGGDVAGSYEEVFAQLREIFGGFKCSIPVLDLSEHGGAADDVARRKSVDYSKIFGGGGDVARSYDEVFAQLRTPAKTVSHADTSTPRKKEEENHRETPDQAPEGVKQYSTFYNRTSQSSKDGENGTTTHVAHIRAVPGFTCFIDENTQKTKGVKFGPLTKDKIRPTPKVSVDFEKKQTADNTEKLKRDSSWEKLYSPDRNVTNSFKTSSPTMVPASAASEAKRSRESKFNFSKMGAENTGSDIFSLSFSDEELDVNSTAAVSAAALKRAVMEAEGIIRLAKEIMERKKNGIQKIPRVKKKNLERARAGLTLTKLKEFDEVKIANEGVRETNDAKCNSYDDVQEHDIKLERKTARRSGKSSPNLVQRSENCVAQNVCIKENDENVEVSVDRKETLKMDNLKTTTVELEQPKGSIMRLFMKNLFGKGNDNKFPEVTKENQKKGVLEMGDTNSSNFVLSDCNISENVDPQEKEVLEMGDTDGSNFVLSDRNISENVDEDKENQKKEVLEMGDTDGSNFVLCARNISENVDEDKENQKKEVLEMGDTNGSNFVLSARNISENVCEDMLEASSDSKPLGMVPESVTIENKKTEDLKVEHENGNVVVASVYDACGKVNEDSVELSADSEAPGCTNESNVIPSANNISENENDEILKTFVDPEEIPEMVKTDNQKTGEIKSYSDKIIVEMLETSSKLVKTDNLRTENLDLEHENGSNITLTVDNGPKIVSENKLSIESVNMDNQENATLELGDRYGSEIVPPVELPNECTEMKKQTEDGTLELLERQGKEVHRKRKQWKDIEGKSDEIKIAEDEGQSSHSTIVQEPLDRNKEIYRKRRQWKDVEVKSYGIKIAEDGENSIRELKISSSEEEAVKSHEQENVSGESSNVNIDHGEELDEAQKRIEIDNKKECSIESRIGTLSTGVCEDRGSVAHVCKEDEIEKKVLESAEWGAYEMASKVESNESEQNDGKDASERLGDGEVAQKYEGDDSHMSFEESERMSDASQSSVDFKEDFIFEEELGETSEVFQSCEFDGFENEPRYVEVAKDQITVLFNGIPETDVSSDNDSGDKQTEPDGTDYKLANDKSVEMESRIGGSELLNLLKGDEKLKGVYEQEWVTIISRKKVEEKTRLTNEETAEEYREREVRAEKEQLDRNDEIVKREREREKNRMVVERAIREARERAFAEARERAERAAVEKATAEARERVMAEARQKFEKTNLANKSSTEKVNLQAKLRSERAAVERAHAEARERALEKALSQKSIFPSSKLDGNNGESVERRNARLEKTQRTMERAAKALAEKNMRDLRAQREQAERNRLAETLDAEIKRWSSGKTGNLRALLSTLHYILGSDSGWVPVSLTEIVTTSAVKKAYRKATLHVHPDKLQQRGATTQQKYICEKVFDLLKAAWNRFNSEER